MKQMKSICLAIMAIVFPAMAIAQDEVAFEFDKNNADVNKVPFAEMERNTSRLLTAINKAESGNSKSLDFNGINILDVAANSLAMIWGNVHFRVIDDDIVQKCLTLKANGAIRGYEASNIAVEMKPIDDAYKESLNQEITISFDVRGRISDVVISMGMHQYSTLMKGAKSLEDIDRRMQILHYVEQFRTAYCQKDSIFMENIFSDDALIITGRVQKRITPEKGMTTIVGYTGQTKGQYLNNLKKVFKRNKYINVQFDDIEIEYNPIRPYIYGVTLRQKWYSSTYSDDGILFLLWDFSNEHAPKIYVRAWQELTDPHRFKTAEFDF